MDAVALPDDMTAVPRVVERRARALPDEAPEHARQAQDDASGGDGRHPSGMSDARQHDEGGALHDHHRDREEDEVRSNGAELRQAHLKLLE